MSEPAQSTYTYRTILVPRGETVDEEGSTINYTSLDGKLTAIVTWNIDDAGRSIFEQTIIEGDKIQQSVYDSVGDVLPPMTFRLVEHNDIAIEEDLMSQSLVCTAAFLPVESAGALTTGSVRTCTNSESHLTTSVRAMSRPRDPPQGVSRLRTIDGSKPDVGEGEIVRFLEALGLSQAQGWQVLPRAKDGWIHVGGIAAVREKLKIGPNNFGLVGPVMRILRVTLGKVLEPDRAEKYFSANGRAIFGDGLWTNMQQTPNSNISLAVINSRNVYPTSFPFKNLVAINSQDVLDAMSTQGQSRPRPRNRASGGAYSEQQPL